jgi:hypothetical protein
MNPDKKNPALELDDNESIMFMRKVELSLLALLSNFGLWLLMSSQYHDS